MDRQPLWLPALAASIVGQPIGPYQVGREVGRGGMAAVFEAHHQRLGPAARAAIKFLSPDLADSPEYAARFFNEARAASLVSHPGVVRIIDFGQFRLSDQTLPYILMEYLEGESLWACFCRLGRRCHPLWPRLIRQIATAMAAVHEQQIVHRDLKPMNVMLLADADIPDRQRVKVVDFGIAKLQPQHYHPDNTVLQTTSGAMLGTPLYMSPEQCARVDSLDGKSDVYSLGSMLYQMLSGQPLFSDLDPNALIRRQMSAQPEPLARRAPALPAALTRLVHAMLDKLPSHRPTMVEVAEHLAPWDHDPPPGASPAGRHAPQTQIIPPLATLRVSPMTALRQWLDRLERALNGRPR